jgi:GNAT superfamily N-acetyltransferase
MAARANTHRMKRKIGSPAKITLRELVPAEIKGIYPLVALHNTGMPRREFTARLKEMMPLGYRVLAAFDGTRMIGVSGFWIGMRFWCGRLIDIDNFIVHPDYRSGGVGVQLLAWLEKKALAEKCELMVLDVYAQSFLAHRFYHRHGFAMTGYHMTKIPGSTTPFVPVHHDKKSKK